MNYIIERKENLVIFQINDKKIEGTISANYKAEFLIFCQPELNAFIIDLHAVESMDSAGFGALLLAYRQLKDHGIPVILTRVNEYIKSLMDMTQINSLFEFDDSIKEAIDGLDLEEN
ncbi:STAS domain-containing protein [Candidatus Kapabacteria bacterium]|nr:STAS domain-containing protein [Candidatus Kapabacteria bacterium]